MTTTTWSEQKLWYPIYNHCVRRNAADIPYEEFSCILQESIQAGEEGELSMIQSVKAFLYSTYQS
jgi:hypothetical protein